MILKELRIHELIAYCGLYCGACSFKRAATDKDPRHLASMPAKYDKHKDTPLDNAEVCPGCRMENNCGQCFMRDCAVERGITHCGHCEDFPCAKLQEFNDDGIPHHGEAINNLRELKDMGEEKWLQYQDKAWNCACGARLSWYMRACPECTPKE